MSKERYVAGITGVGRSATGRALGREPVDLAAEGVLAAIADAGLTRDDIDGLAAFVSDSGAVDAPSLRDAIGLDVDWYTSTMIGPSQLTALFDAIMAVETGRARHAVAFHASCEGTVRKRLGSHGSVPGSANVMPERVATLMQQEMMPWGAPSVANMIAMYAMRHFHEFGTTREQMAQIALVARANAGKNPHGIYRDPLTMQDYLGARMISEPFALYDCDVPIDFCTAVVVSRVDSTYGLRRKPIMIEAIGTAVRGRATVVQFEDLTTMPLRDAGAALWRETDLRPADVDVAMLYDGFSWLAMAWLEALNFCGHGESGPFIEGGNRIALDGELPINTHGGQLSSGRMHGWGYVPEACIQLWGEGGERQVPNNPEVAVVGCGGGLFAGAMLLTQ
jgi:acetyl-CoA acetyltransferase